MVLGGGREKWEHNINTGKPHREAFHYFIPGCLCNRPWSLGESISSFVHDLLPNKTSQKEASSREEAANIQLIGSLEMVKNKRIHIC